VDSNAIDKMILSLTNEDKEQIIKVWSKNLASMPDFKREIIEERINWLEFSMKKKKKVKKEKSSSPFIKNERKKKNKKS